MEQQHDLLNNDLVVNEISQANLNVAARWGKFLAIVGIIFCALMLFAGITVQTVGTTISRYSSVPGYLGIIYMVMAVLFFFPSLYMLRFSTKMQEAIRNGNQDSLDNSFLNLKAMFRFYGIITIVCFGAYIVLVMVLMNTGFR